MKKKVLLLATIVLLCIITVVLSGCSNENTEENSNLQIVNENNENESLELNNSVQDEKVNQEKETGKESEEEISKNLKVGAYTLEYGTYKCTENNTDFILTLNSDGTCSYSGPDIDSGSGNKNLTGNVTVTQFEDYTDIVDGISIAFSDGSTVNLQIISDNQLGNQWLLFKHDGNAVQSSTSTGTSEATDTITVNGYKVKTGRYTGYNISKGIVTIQINVETSRYRIKNNTGNYTIQDNTLVCEDGTVLTVVGDEKLQYEGVELGLEK